jgi:hypothetical protein
MAKKGRKCLEVTEEVWKRVMVVKYEKGFRSVDELLKHLLELFEKNKQN